MVVVMQLITIIITRGDVYLLGEAYAFGVVWSFSMKALSVLVLRYKQPSGREWKVPFNIYIGKTEIPIGLILITLSLFALAVINVLTKKVATISGLIFTVAFFIVFELSDIANRKRKPATSMNSKNSAWIRAKKSRPTAPTCGQGTCWSRSAIRIACSTCSAF